MSHSLAFFYRAARFLLHRYHLIPTWLKLVKLLVIISALYLPQWWEDQSQKTQFRSQYDFYYDHGLTHYRRYFPEAQAHKHAAAYAQRFAEYYHSGAYKKALRTALPVTPTPQLEQAVKQAPPVIREMAMAGVGYDLIKHFEGLRLRPYRDPAGKLTIGYGHLIRPGEVFTTISKAKAEQLLQHDIHIAEMLVKQHVKVPLSTSQFSALVALVYNIGSYQFRTSTLLSVINQGDYNRAAEELLRWEKADGLILRGLAKRRYAEYLLFTGKWRS